MPRGRKFWTNEERVARAVAGDPRRQKEIRVYRLADELGERVGDLGKADDRALDDMLERLLEKRRER